MSDANTNTGHEIDHQHDHLQISVAAFLLGVTVFFVGSAIFTVLGGTPPSSTPVVSVSGHLLWFVSVAFLAVGATAFLLNRETPRLRLAGYLAVGTLGLGVLHGLQWATWTYVDVLAAQHADYELILDTTISPFGAGHALMYAMLIGCGIAFFGWESRHTDLVHRYLAWTGIVLGVVAFLGTGIVLVRASAPDTPLFGVMILLIPLLYLWSGGVAASIYRRQ